MVRRDDSLLRRVSERLALAGASAAIFLGGLGLLGWATPWRRLASLAPASIPMAPSTALALLLLGGALMLAARRRSPRLTMTVALLVAVFSCVQLATFAAGSPPSLDTLLVPAPGLFSGFPTGRMSPWTSLGLMIASLGLLFASLSQHFVGPAKGRRVLRDAGGFLAIAVCLLASVVSFGYLFGAPLLYGGTAIPVAFPTALAMACLGLALVGLTPRESAPMRPLTGSSARAKLLRAFLPVAPAIVVADLLVDLVGGLNPALHAPLAALLAALVVVALVSHAARGVGAELDRAQAERERSRAVADRLAAIVESSSEAIYAKSLDGTIVAWNASAAHLFGYPAGEVVGRSAKILMPPGAEGELTEILARIGAGERIDHKETTRKHKDGSLMLLSLSESPLHDAEGRVVGVSVIAHDVSERSRAETALRQSEADFRLLAEAMPQIVWITRPAGWNVALNQQWMDYTGLSREESLGHGWNRPFHPEDQQRAWDAWQHATMTIGVYSLECRLRRADGVYRWWLVRGVPVRDATGTVRNWFGTCTDIDDLKHALTVRDDAERRLLETAEEYRLLFESNPHPMWVFDAETLAFLAVNDAAVRLYGFSRDEFLDMTIQDIRPENEVAALLQYLQTMPDDPSLPAVQVKHWKKDRSLVEVEASSSPIEFRGRRAHLVLAHDITERKQLEAQLLQAQKMEAVGLLAGGVAHDFNNALGVILGYTELLMRQAGEAERGKLEQVLKSTNRASVLTRQLLAFSRKQVVDPKVLDLNALLSDLERMLGRLIGEDIDLAILPDPNLGAVMADQGQLEQVIMNLCVNARDAMPGGGMLRIETSNVELDERQAPPHEVIPSGRYVRLAVSDSGCGIERGTLPKIFEPFFTTKDLGKGTGLGLAMVYGIVKQAGGYVWADSVPGHGSTFEIHLPRVDEPVGRWENRDTPMPSRGWETVLLVEDEDPLRELAREILVDQGYRVIEAASAVEALDIASQHREPIHLLLTDVVMPGRNGRELAESLMAARPGLRVLYMSGYTDDIIAHSGVLNSGLHLLEKPFTALALLKRVRATLAERSVGENA